MSQKAWKGPTLKRSLVVHWMFSVFQTSTMRNSVVRAMSNTSGKLAYQSSAVSAIPSPPLLSSLGPRTTCSLEFQGFWILQGFWSNRNPARGLFKRRNHRALYLKAFKRWKGRYANINHFCYSHDKPLCSKSAKGYETHPVFKSSFQYRIQWADPPTKYAVIVSHVYNDLYWFGQTDSRMDVWEKEALQRSNSWNEVYLVPRLTEFEQFMVLTLFPLVALEYWPPFRYRKWSTIDSFQCSTIRCLVQKSREPLHPETRPRQLERRTDLEDEDGAGFQLGCTRRSNSWNFWGLVLGYCKINSTVWSFSKWWVPPVYPMLPEASQPWSVWHQWWWEMPLRAHHVARIHVGDWDSRQIYRICDFYQTEKLWETIEVRSFQPLCPWLVFLIPCPRRS